MNSNNRYRGYRALFWLLSLLLLILIMFMIFRFSSENSVESSMLSHGLSYDLVRTIQRFFPGMFSEESLYRMINLVETPIRKLAHFSEYTCFSFFMQIHLSSILQWQISWKRNEKTVRIIGVIFCILYSISDEIHQYFVPGRACRVFDVGIDSLGILFGFLLFCLIFRRLLDVIMRKG